MCSLIAAWQTFQSPSLSVAVIFVDVVLDVLPLGVLSSAFLLTCIVVDVVLDVVLIVLPFLVSVFCVSSVSVLMSLMLLPEPIVTRTWLFFEEKRQSPSVCLACCMALFASLWLVA